jgi:hypothetical protein
MTVAVDVVVPQPLAEEILQRYADVLRVGRVLVNGCEVCWSTSGSTAIQLEAFSAAFCAALRKLPESQGLEDAVLWQAVYWFCKVVSINYVLCEVLHLVKDKVGKDCSIRTSDSRGRSILDYAVQVQPDHSMCVQLSWREKDNVIYCNPKTAQKKVKGTLSLLKTEFPLPPSPCFTPTYSLSLKVKRSRKSTLISKVACIAKSQRRLTGESLFVDSPLHSSSTLNLEAWCACSTEAPSLTSDLSVDSMFDDDSWDAPSPSSSREISSPLHMQTYSVTALPCDCTRSPLRKTADLQVLGDAARAVPCNLEVQA